MCIIKNSPYAEITASQRDNKLNLPINDLTEVEMVSKIKEALERAGYLLIHDLREEDQIEQRKLGIKTIARGSLERRPICRHEVALVDMERYEFFVLLASVSDHYRINTRVTDLLFSWTD